MSRSFPKCLWRSSLMDGKRANSSNYTASLTSSVVEYPVEHGRRYHAYRAGSKSENPIDSSARADPMLLGYSRPNDEVIPRLQPRPWRFNTGQWLIYRLQLEDERLLLLHQIMTLAIGWLYLAPIDKDKIHRILDIGTGTGICERDRASTYITTYCSH